MVNANHIRPQVIHPQVVNHINEQINLNSYQECVVRNDFSSIVKNKELFWAAYCKTAATIPEGQWDSFTITLENNSANVVAHPSNMSRMKDAVEKLRKVYEEALNDNSDFSIGLLNTDSVVYSTLFKEISNTHSQEYIKDFAANLSTKSIKSVIPSFAESCGMTCVKVNENKLIEGKSVPIEVMQMHWKTEFHFVSPIPLKTIPEQTELGNSLYDLYKQGQFCDFAIISEKAQKQFMIHIVVLYANGGKFFKNILNTSMKESSDKKIYFNTYSENTISALIDFIYLGSKNFQKNVLEGRLKVDLTELFAFAHTYEMDILKDCCFNLFCLLSIPEHANQIAELAEYYSDNDLKALSANLCCRCL
jgi:BTB/POZ domain